MKDYVNLWMDELEKIMPDYEDHANGLYYYLLEYWKTKFDVMTRTAQIDFQIYPDYIPGDFKERAVQIASDYFNLVLSTIVNSISDMMAKARKRDIVPDTVFLPWHIVEKMKFEDKGMTRLFGLYVKYTDQYVVRIESKQFNYFDEEYFKLPDKED